MPIKVVSVHEVDAGSLDWELPRDVSAMISLLPQEEQVFMLSVLRNHVEAHLHMLLGTVRAGSSAHKRFDVINENQIKLLHQLMDMAR